jgi:uracil-DNA glycosylase
MLGLEPYNLLDTTGRPYADGLAYSTESTEKYPPALDNILKATSESVPFWSCKQFDGNLSRLSEQGVFLLNKALTVEKGTTLSHAHIGWERLTQAAIEALKQNEVVVWFLFGPELQKLEPLITNPHHKIIKCEHPELAYKEKRAWDYNNCFLDANEYLIQNNHREIIW